MTLEWMLDNEPSLRWQVERDLLDAPESTWQATRARVATEGFGARLLALQDADGQWAGGAFFPAGFDFDGPEAQPGAGQPWTATNWSLTSLREWGVDAAALDDTASRIAAHSRWEYDDLPYWGGEVDVCINAFTLANAAWLGVETPQLSQWFLDHELAEGGWNCEWVEGSTRSSVESTLNALKGILYWEQVTGNDLLRDARHRGEQYLLERHLINRLSVDRPLNPRFARFSFPFRAQYTLLNALDYFRSAALHDEVVPDARLADAIDSVRAGRQPDGTWLQEPRRPGRVWFEVDVPPGEPSPWLTFYASRVLRWWDRADSKK